MTDSNDAFSITSIPLPVPEEQLAFTLPSGALALFNQLVEQRVLGETPEEVARYLIMRELQDLLGSGVVRRKRL